MRRLQDRIALVTGGAAGLGAAIVRRLASEGARVVITDIDASQGEMLAKELNCQFIEQDVAEEEQWQVVVQKVQEQLGALHVLVNNAGIEGPFDAADPESARLSDWRAIYRVNVEGVFLGCRAAIPALRRSGGGAIINLSSTAALGATPDYMAYGASKAAVLHMTKSVALHCARDGSKIRCNSVHPGIVLTPMLRRIVEDVARKRGAAPEKALSDFQGLIPQGEFQEPDDVASIVAFLASAEAKHITGTSIVVDGGTTLGGQPTQRSIATSDC